MKVGLSAQASTQKMFGLVRDKDGKPLIKDIDNCPSEILSMLTSEELKELKENR